MQSAVSSQQSAGGGEEESLVSRALTASCLLPTAYFFVSVLFLAAIDPVQAQQATTSPAQSPTAPVVSVEQRSSSLPANAPTKKQSKHSAIPTNLLDMRAALGDFFLIVFLAASVIAVWFAIERIVVLRRSRVIPRPFVERFLRHLEQGALDRERALKLCEESKSPVASVFAHGIRKWGKPSVEVEQAIIDGGERQVSQLRKNLRVLNGVATVTPLLGLLGTIFGMIQAFNEIAHADAMGKADQLAVGIAMALLTTAAGLLIAIPSLILYLFLAGRVDSLVMEMDLLAQDVVQLISAEALAEKPIPAARARSRHASPQPKSGPKERRAV